MDLRLFSGVGVPKNGWLFFWLPLKKEEKKEEKKQTQTQVGISDGRLEEEVEAVVRALQSPVALGHRPDRPPGVLASACLEWTDRWKRKPALFSVWMCLIRAFPISGSNIYLAVPIPILTRQSFNNLALPAPPERGSVSNLTKNMDSRCCDAGSSIQGG